ncbi:MAG: Fe-S cluster assembly ATPase SufC [Gammaproteobacteria bacterium]|nr:Fe-S cluster assembly ATPase SufC [Gammaproteobacteria bacterium]MCY4340552.1 Fe-S cluster assembly ATPase SufC [Gammaproteobacteria bacterium]
MSKPLLDIRGLKVSVEGKEILSGLSLEVGPGEVHAIMGPNGAGKSTLAQALAGRDGYGISGGSVLFGGEDLLAMNPEERACKGLFLGFQYPVEIPGVSNMYLLRSALNAQRKASGQPEINAAEFLKAAREEASRLKLKPELLKRGVNEGFSGGEKKRNEILQLAVLKPRLAVLDETDSGLDIDALKVVASGIGALRDGKRAFVLITHYERILNLVSPDKVHVLAGGAIARSGGAELVAELEADGYDAVLREAA